MEYIVRVVPAILTEDPRALEAMVHQVEGFMDYAQIDFMDGEFVPSRSITPEHVTQLQTKLGWEAHLMVLHPETYPEGLRQAGARKVIFHYEATNTPEEVIRAIRGLGLRVGMAINPETSVSAIEPFLREIDSVLLLSVHPGFYGSKFIPEVPDKIAELRLIRHDIEIGIDGGVKESNIVEIAEKGPNAIYVGSAILLQPNPAESYRRLQDMVSNACQHIPE
ncbi:MAG: ribulose-phosphate 3-epimerase [Chloroflexota bacterium]|nr:ribulose-phosphate 3-epimerase [Chloroflexota bacterium]